MVEDRAIEINVTVRGTYVRGTYSVDAGSITVRSGWWKKSTQIDGSADPEDLARIMLREMVEDVGVDVVVT
jgi:hypothetical protein